MLQVRKTKPKKINTPSCDHYDSLTVYILGIHHDHDLSHVCLSVALCAFISQQIVSKTSNTSMLIVRYWKWCLNQCEKIPNSTPSEDQINTATGRNLFQDNGIINIHGLIKSSKGYTVQNQLLDWLSTTFSQCGESWHLFAVQVQFITIPNAVTTEDVQILKQKLVEWSEFVRFLSFDLKGSA